MSKVKCKDCKHWLQKGLTHKRGSMFSLSYDYEPVGTCMSVECGRETSGYTGIASGHKMRRLGERERYCRFFELKEGEVKIICSWCGIPSEYSPSELYKLPYPEEGELGWFICKNCGSATPYKEEDVVK